MKSVVSRVACMRLLDCAPSPGATFHVITPDKSHYDFLKAKEWEDRPGHLRRPSTGMAACNYCPNLFLYSVEVMKAFTISAWMKLPLNSSSLPSQKL